MELLLLSGLFIKHFIIDFPMQTRYQYSNKGTYGHLGGILHSGLHGLGTLLILMLVLGTIDNEIKEGVVLLLAFADSVIHYHVDWAKIKLNKRFDWQPMTSEKYWWLLGFDQLLHSLTYISIVAILVSFL